MQKTADPSLETEEVASLKAYEIMLLWKPDILESKFKEKLKEFEEFVKHGGGKVVTNDIWEKQKLAYKIGPHREGLYVIYDLELPPSSIKELNEHLRIDPELIRYIIVTLPPNYTYTKYVEEKIEEERPRREYAAKPASFKYVAPVEAKPAEKTKAPVEKTPAKEVDEVALEKKLDELLEGEDFKL